MYKNYQLLLILKLITCSFTIYASNPDSDLDTQNVRQENYSRVSASPVKIDSKPTQPKGYFKINEDKLQHVRVQFYLSLGDPFIAKISEQIRKSDQFSFAFMYRFNSPILLKSFQKQAKNCVLFLDRNQCYEDKDKQNYNDFIQDLIQKVPTSLIDLKSKSFHQKVIICKTKGRQAVTIIGSANATFEAENKHSEDVFFIQSNYFAKIFMKTFYNLFNVTTLHKKDQKQRLIDIYHQRLIEGYESNTDCLLESLKILKEDNSELDLNFGLEATISSLAISTGFSTGNKGCSDLFQQQIVPTKENKILILLQNYLTQDSKFFDVIKEDKSKKLIILDDNRNNDKSFDKLNQLNKDEVLPIKFKNFAQGKFHHKASLQYKIDGTRIVYTGSFNLSKNAVQNNSECIFGIKNKELPGIFLSTLLRHNSSLNNNLNVWEFISKNPELNSDNNIKKQARRTISDINQNLQDHKVNFFTAIEELETKVDAGFDYKIIKFFKDKLDNEKIDLLEEINTYSELIDFIFKDQLSSVYFVDIVDSNKLQFIQKFILKKVNTILKDVETLKQEMNNIIKKRERKENFFLTGFKNYDDESESEDITKNYLEVEGDIELKDLRDEIKNIKDSIESFKEDEKNRNIEKIIIIYNEIKFEIDKFNGNNSKKLENNINKKLNKMFFKYQEYLNKKGIKLEIFQFFFEEEFKNKLKDEIKQKRANYLEDIGDKINKNIILLNKKLNFKDLKKFIDGLEIRLKDLNELTNILNKIQEIPLIIVNLLNLKNTIEEICKDI